MENKHITTIMDDLTRNDSLVQIALGEDYKNYMYTGDLMLYINEAINMGYRDMGEYMGFLKLDDKRLENILSILNRHSDNPQLSVGGGDSKAFMDFFKSETPQK